MADFLTPAQRSERMSRIRSRDTSPELALRKALHARGFRFRLDDKRLPGKPDIVLPKYRTAILVHGCFWHRHADCNIATTPKSNTAFWNGKFERNVQRDVRVTAELQALGWRVLVAWECELGSSRRTQETAENLAARIRMASADNPDRGGAPNSSVRFRE
jgi:DNA mismatch endonuclease (patch repair protein)